jgi:hypothetical protein
MFLRAARRCFEDAIFVTSISSLDLTLRYRATAQQQTWEIQGTNQRREVDAFRLKRLPGMLDKRAVTISRLRAFPFESHCGTYACNKANETS